MAGGEDLPRDAPREGPAGDRTELADTLCVARTTWIVGSNTAQLANPWLFHAQLVAVNDGIAAWRFAGSPTGDPHCLDAPPPVQAPASAHTSGASGND